MVKLFISISQLLDSHLSKRRQTHVHNVFLMITPATNQQRGKEGENQTVEKEYRQRHSKPRIRQDNGKTKQNGKHNQPI